MNFLRCLCRAAGAAFVVISAAMLMVFVLSMLIVYGYFQCEVDLNGFQCAIVESGL